MEIPAKVPKWKGDLTEETSFPRRIAEIDFGGLIRYAAIT